MREQPPLHSVAKAIDLLFLFREAPGPLSVAVMAERLGLPRSSVYRYVQTLTRKGLLEESDARGEYRLGLALVELARSALGNADLADLAGPVLQELWEATRETVLLTIPRGRMGVCIARLESPEPLRISYEIGRTRPLHAGASSKALLAFMDASLVEEILSGPLERFTENTITDPDVLRRELAHIRDSGFACSDQEMDLGAMGVGAPVFDPRGRLVAAVSVIWPRERRHNIDRFSVLVRDAARRIEQRLVASI